MATCAAPPYFDPVEINGSKFSDGAFRANNPVFKAANEAREIWVNSINANGSGEIQPLVSCMLSIGTGESKYKELGNTAVTLLRTLGSMATQTQETSDMFMREWRVPRREKRAFRLNVQHSLGEVGLAEFDAQPMITDFTDDYLTHPGVKDVFDDCVDSLCSDGMSRQTAPTAMKLIKGVSGRHDVGLKTHKHSYQHLVILTSATQHEGIGSKFL